MRMIVPAVVAALVLGLGAAAAQEESAYDLTLPQGWEQSSYVDGAQIRRVEYVYGDRSQAMLKVRRVRVPAGQSASALIEREIDNLRFLPGFLPSRTEQFGGGNFAGAMVQFDFDKGGRPQLGRHYYLVGDDATVWALQFSGDRDVLGRMRNVTDQMARTFRAK